MTDGEPRARGMEARGDRGKTRSEADEQIEASVRALLDRGDLPGATALAVQGYGAEVYGFMASVLADIDAARDVYSLFCERLWRGLPGFHWQCPLRLWSYVIARRELARYRTTAGRREARHVPLSQAPSAASPEPTVTQPFQRTTARDAIALLRAELTPEDREILVLRLDRQLSWKDIALAFLGLQSTEEDPEEIERESNRLRQRFTSVKKQLAKAAVLQGLIPGTPNGNEEARRPGTVLSFHRRRERTR